MSKPIYRFKFSTDICNSITDFAKLHQFDDRATYKEAWQLWCTDNDNLICDENERLQRLGYNHDIVNKLYRSSRYYYRCKKDNDETSSLQEKPKRTYINLSKDTLNIIKEHLNENKNNEVKFSPSQGYNIFCENYKETIDKEAAYLENTFSISNDEATKKIKKTYKNKYFQIIN